MPLISVIMPAYNASKYIREALESVLNQTEADFELLISDDASTDNTKEILDTYSDIRIKRFDNNKNQGYLKTCNKLLRKATGSLIAFNDADDVSREDRFEILLNYLKLNPNISAIGSNCNLIDENGVSIEMLKLPSSSKDIILAFLNFKDYCIMNSLLFKKDILTKVGYYNEYFDRKGAEDMYWFSLIIQHFEVANINESLYYYRKHNTSFSFNQKQKKKRNIILEHLDILLVNAYNMRLNNHIDYFETEDENAMKIYISNYHLRRAENYFWENNLNKSLKHLLNATKANMFNFKVYRTLFFILRKSIKLQT